MRPQMPKGSAIGVIVRNNTCDPVEASISVASTSLSVGDDPDPVDGPARFRTPRRRARGHLSAMPDWPRVGDRVDYLAVIGEPPTMHGLGTRSEVSDSIAT
jgi:hypothetical protein